MTQATYDIRPIGVVESPLKDPATAPLQGDEGAPDAWLVIDPAVLDAVHGLQPGARIIVLSWFDRADRDVLQVHPRGDAANPAQGVFNTRSPDRPNPVGLHPVKIVSISDGGCRIQVRDLEALDGTPIVDIKPVLGPVSTR